MIMTPQQKKAKEIVDKFEDSEFCSGNHFPNKNYCDCGNGMNYHQAKQCAIIMCDEIIRWTPHGLGQTPRSKEYWKSVKTEIEKL